jgi:hypothetical protein
LFVDDELNPMIEEQDAAAGAARPITAILFIYRGHSPELIVACMVVHGW